MNKPTLQKPPPPSPLPLAISLPLPHWGVVCGGQQQTRQTATCNFSHVSYPSFGHGGRGEDIVTESPECVSEKSRETPETTKDTPQTVGGITSNISLQYELQQQIASIKWYEWIQLARYSTGQSQFAQLLTQAVYAGLRDSEWRDSTIVEQLLRVRCVSETDYVSARREALELLELVSAYSNAKICFTGAAQIQKLPFQFVAPSTSEHGSRKRKLSRRPTPYLDSLLSKAKKYRKQENWDPSEAQSKFQQPPSLSPQNQSQILQNNNLNTNQPQEQFQNQQSDQQQNQKQQLSQLNKPHKRRKVKRNSSCSSIPDTCQVIHQPKSQTNNNSNKISQNQIVSNQAQNSSANTEYINNNIIKSGDMDISQHELFILGTPHDSENKAIKRLLPRRLSVNEVCCIDSLVIGDRKVYKCEIVSLDSRNQLRAKQMAMQHQVAVVSIQEKGHILLVPTFLNGENQGGNLEGKGLFVLVVTTQHLTFKSKIAL